MDWLENTTHTVKINKNVFFFLLTPWKVDLVKIHDSRRTAILQTQYVMNGLIDDDV